MISSFIRLLGLCGTLLLPKPLYFYVGEPICRSLTGIVAYGTIHWVFGGFGIALMRWLVIKRPSMVKLGEMTSAFMVSIAMNGFSVLIGHIRITTPHPKYDLNSLCLARSMDFTKTYFEYTSDLYKIQDTKSIFLLVVGFIVAEFALYVSICMFLIRSDRRIASYLSNHAIRRRKRKNVITLVGSMINFAFEVTWLSMPTWILPLLARVCKTIDSFINLDQDL